MPSLLFHCTVCGSMHEVPGRPGGTVYLRCAATREWAWYDASSFESPSLPGAPRPRGAGTGPKTVRGAGTSKTPGEGRPSKTLREGRQAAATGATASARRPRPAARGARGSSGRKAAGRAGRRKRR